MGSIYDLYDEINDILENEKNPKEDEEVPPQYLEMMEAIKDKEKIIKQAIMITVEQCTDEFDSMREIIKEIFECQDLKKLESLKNKLQYIHFNFWEICSYKYNLDEHVYSSVIYDPPVGYDWDADIIKIWCAYFCQHYSTFQSDNLGDYDSGLEKYQQYESVNILDTILTTKFWKNKFNIEFENIETPIKQLYFKNHKKSKLPKLE